MTNNPFTLTFGKYPQKYISRYENIDIVCNAFEGDTPLSQIYMIEGVRGSGKTVLMTAIGKYLQSSKEWIVVDINSTRDLLEDLAHRLYDSLSSIPKLLDKGFNVSVGGVTVGVGGSAEFRDNVSIINGMLDTSSKKGKKILITIDEVMHNKNIREFAAQFQIWLRQDYPVFLLMTGLYENINSIQNDPALTFLLRSPKIRLEPLSIRQILNQYMDIFKIDEQAALNMAEMTKGYAFAFQALGMLYWQYGADGHKDEIIRKYDELLEDFAYKKIWETLADNERKIIHCMCEDKVKVEHIRKELNMSPGTFSQYRDKLIKSGIVISGSHGYLTLALPRFYEVTRLL